MRNTTKTLSVLMMAAFMTVSCGKKDNSSGSGSNAGISDYAQATAYGSIDEVRQAFAAKSLADGAAVGTEVYHVGSYFGASNSSSSFSASVSGCAQILFWSIGDCGTNTSQQENYMLDKLNKGKYRTVTQASVDSLGYKIPDGIEVTNNLVEYTYDETISTFDRTNSIYKEMLALESNNILETRVSAATIKFQNNSEVAGQIVEVVYGNQTYGNQTVTGMKRFVLSTNLPTIANPIAVINGYYPSLSGFLSGVGTPSNYRMIKSITVSTLHNLQKSWGYNSEAVYTLTPQQNYVIQ
jgi:hypothetical protein